METAGTAMKTIIARFSEVKELFSQGQLTGTDSEGEEININKIDTALQQVGISLKEFLLGNQGLDDVFLQLAEKWDTLDLATQRYIATVAAGSRQQSRFLAMMSNYDRTMELVNAAYNSTGASSAQFEKTMDSLEAKLNELSNAWNEFTMHIANSDLIKGAVDLLTAIISAVNKLISLFGGGLLSSIVAIGTAFGGWAAGRAIIRKLGSDLAGFVTKAKTTSSAAEGVAEAFEHMGKASAGVGAKDIFGNAKKQSKNFVEGLKSALKSFEKAKNIEDLQRDFSFVGLNSKNKNYDFSADIERLAKKYHVATSQLELYKDAILAGNTAQEASILLKDRDVAATIAQAKATENLTKEQLKQRVAQEAANKASTTGTVTKTAGLGRNILTAIFGRTENAAKAGKAAMDQMAASGSKLQGVLGKVFNVIGNIPGPLKALTAAFAAGKIAYDLFVEDSDDKLERLNEEMDRARITAQNTQTAFNELSTSIDSIKNYQDNFEGLTIGTNEWREALLQANQTVLDLLDKFPELNDALRTNYIGDAMQLTIDEQALESFYNEQLQKQANVQSANLMSQLAVLQAEQKAQEEEIALARKEQENEIRKNVRNSGRYKGSGYLPKETQAEVDAAIEELADTETIQARNQRQAELENSINLLYSSLIGGVEGASDEVKNALNRAAVKIADDVNIDDEIQAAEKRLKETYQYEDTAREAYKDLTGAEAEEDWSYDEIINEIARLEVTNDLLSGIQDSVNQINRIQGLSNQQQADLIDAVYGTMDASRIQELLADNSNLTNGIQDFSAFGVNSTNKEAFDAWLEQIGITHSQALDNFNQNLQNAAWGLKLLRDGATGANADANSIINRLSAIRMQLEAGQVPDLTGFTTAEFNAIDPSTLTTEQQALWNQASQNRVIYNYEQGKDYQQNRLLTETSQAGIDENGVETLKQSLMELNPLLEQNDALLEAVTATYLQLDNGLKAVAEAWEVNAEALSNPDDIVEYNKALSNLQESVSDLVGTSVDLDFVKENLELIEQAINGDTDALIELQRHAAIEIVADLNLPDEQFAALEGFVNEYNGFEMEMGATLHDQNFINTLQNMLNSGQATAEDIQKFLNAIGFTAEIEYDNANLVQQFRTQTSGLSGIAGTIASGALNVLTTATHTVPYIRSIHAVGGEAPKAATKPRNSGGKSSGGGGGGGRKSSGGGSAKKEEPWENGLDRLYNLLEEITEEQRELNKLEQEFDDLINDSASSSEEVLENLYKQEASLERQALLQQKLYDERKVEMKNLLAANKDLGKYATYDWKNEVIQIDWDAIEKVTNQDTGERIEKYIEELERIQDSMDEATDALYDIEDQIEELKDYGKDEYGEFEQMTLDAIVSHEERRLDSIENISNALYNSNQELLQTLRDNIDDMRQQRQNEEAEEQISDTENYLAYLQRDTSNANLLEILRQREQLEQQRENYTDQLIDQKINELEEQNNLAFEQREEQLEIARAQLEHQVEYGLLWDEVNDLWHQGIDNDGVILPGSQLEFLLEQHAGVEAMSKFQKGEWATEMRRLTVAADTFWKNNSGVGLNGVKTAVERVEAAIGKIKIGTSTVSNSRVTSSNKGGSSSGGSGGRGGSSGSSYGGGSTVKSTTSAKTVQRFLNTWFGAGLSVDGIWGTSSKAALRRVQSLIGVTADGIWGPRTRAEIGKWVLRRTTPNERAAANRDIAKLPTTVYKTGGLADYTGPAWLDGTKRKPELVLNAQDTQNFIQLKDILSDIMAGGLPSAESKSGDNYYDITIEVEELANDYDVDQLAEHVKKIINDDSMYRNVNSIRLMR